MNAAVISGEFPTDGFSINPEYTYTHPEINFIMDDENKLPLLRTDAYGIGYVEYLGGTDINDNNDFHTIRPGIYAYDRKLILEGFNNGMVADIYTITGMLHSRVYITSSRMEKELPLGVYIVKTKTEIKKIVIY
jgi:hypothetical protein